MNWNFQITLWPLIILIIVLIFRKPLSNILSQISEFSFGDLSVKLKRRLKISKNEYEKIKSLTSRDFKFFFVIASQSWKIGRVKWELEIADNIALHQKLENVGLIIIKNKDTMLQDRSVSCDLTSLGEDLYSELVSLISETIK